VPIFTLIPLVGYVIFSKKYNRNLKTFGLWLIPIILIPLIWPAYSISVGRFDTWEDDVIRQSNRQPVSMVNTFTLLGMLDPVFFVIVITSFVLLILKKDVFLLLWIIPNILFHIFIGYFPYREFISFIPVFSIAGAVLIVDLSRKIKYKKIQEMLPFTVIACIGIFGLIFTTILITTSVTPDQFKTVSFVATLLGKEGYKKGNMTIISSPIYSWIFKFVYDKPNVLRTYQDIHYLPVNNTNILLIVDHHFRVSLKSNQLLGAYYKSTTQVAMSNSTNKYDTHKYPYNNMILNNNGLSIIEVRTTH